jgi:FkbM family methyltransferase
MEKGHEMNVHKPILSDKLLDTDIVAYFRPNSSDVDVIREVCERKVYRKKTVGFDVEPGEHWLDLGANIGAFCLYCRMRGAEATAYEPDPENYAILEKNAPRFSLINAAVTSMDVPKLSFFKSNNPENHYRQTIIPVGRYVPAGEFHNVYAGRLNGVACYDGVKMDIEGSEFGLIDYDMIPKTRKLVLEYHTSRDKDWKNLDARLNTLKTKFKHMKYPKVLDDYVERKGDVDLRFDQVVFCWQ